MNPSSTLASLAAVLPLTASAAQATPPEAVSALQAARAGAAAELQVPVLLRAQTTRVAGAWAFVLAELRAADGGSFSYAGTPLAEAAREGFLSKQCAALLARREGRWELVELRIGATDVAWEGWATRHHAPASLFTLP